MAQSMMQPQQALMMHPQQALMVQNNFTHNNAMLQQQQMGMWQQQQQGLPHMMNPGMMQGVGAVSMYSNMGSGGGLSMYSNMGIGGGGGGDMGAAAPAEVKEKETPQEPEKPDLFAGLGDLSAFKKNKPAPTARADNPFGF